MKVDADDEDLRKELYRKADHKLKISADNF